MSDHQPGRAIHKAISYGFTGRVLEILIIVLLAIVAVIPGVLRIMYRADAQVALGNAKLVRTALEMTALEAYGESKPFCNLTCEGGITKEAYQNVLLTSRIPGDFFVTRVDESGYEVLEFFYREGEYLVICETNPISYEVLRTERCIDTQSDEE